MPPGEAAPQKPRLQRSLSALGHLRGDEHLTDERIRTLCLVLLAMAVIAAGAYYLKEIAIPFLQALAISYLLTPIIDFLSCKDASCPLKLPRSIAVFLSFGIAIGVLVVLAAVVTRSIVSFTSEADVYRDRVEELWYEVLGLAHDLQEAVGVDVDPLGNFTKGSLSGQVSDAMSSLAEEADVTNLILSFLGDLGHFAEGLLYVLLFLAFMLLGHSKPEAHRADDTNQAVQQQIFAYIRGKTSIAALCAIINTFILYSIGVGGGHFDFGARPSSPSGSARLTHGLTRVSSTSRSSSAS